MDQEEKEQQARIALLDYFGSLARHWATVLLATAVVFYSVVQARTIIYNEWLFMFALTFTAAQGAYAFLRMVTHGKYCKLALDNEVRPLNRGTYVTGMLRGMHRNLRGLPYWGSLDKLGGRKGFLCWESGSVCACSAVASQWTGLFAPIILMVAVVAILVLYVGFDALPCEIYEGQIEIPEPPER